MYKHQQGFVSKFVLICITASFGFIATSCAGDEDGMEGSAEDGGGSMPSGTDNGSGGSSGSGSGSGGSSGSGNGGSSGGGSSGGGTPDSAYCAEVADWPAEYAALEDEVLQLVNERRSQGASCGSEGQFGATTPLVMDPALQCAARVHTKDMGERDYFSHTNPEGQQPWDRMELAGYGSYRQAGENIAFGSSTAEAVMSQWMSSDGHCANIMSPNFEHIGIGYYEGNLWTQVFGSN